MRLRNAALVGTLITMAGVWQLAQAQNPTGASLQVAASPSMETARAEIGRLERLGIRAYTTVATVDPTGAVYRVRAGRFSSIAAARATGDDLQRRGIVRQYWVVNFDGPADFPYSPQLSPSTATGAKTVGVNKASDLPKLGRSEVPNLSPKGAAPKTQVASDKSSKTEPGNTKPGINEARTPAPASVNRKEKTFNAQSPAAKPAISAAQWTPTNSDLTSDLSRVFFTDDRHGWVVGDGGIVFKTNDGGSRWVRQVAQTEIPLTSIFFLDSRNGWIAGGGTRGVDLRDLMNPDETFLLSTHDGGQTWKRVPGVNVLEMQFTSNQDGWAAGNYGNILKTSDGGEHWQPVTLPESLLPFPVQQKDRVLAFTELSFTSPTDGWIAGNRFGNRGSEAGALLHTADGGQSWQRAELSVFRSGLRGGIVERLHHLRFFSAESGMIVADVRRNQERFSILLATADGGKSWKLRNTFAATLTAVSMSDPMNGWAITQARRSKSVSISKTSDGGRTWRVSTQVRASDLRDLQLLSTEAGWAVGANGSILRLSAKTLPLATTISAPPSSQPEQK